MEENKNKKNNKKEEITILKEQIENLNNEALRAKADLINYRKRKDEEVSNMLKYCNEDILLRILSVIDNFERAIILGEKSLNEENDNFLDGFKLIYGNLKSILEEYNVKEIDCLHKPFDSRLETSMFTESNPDYEDDTVLEVLIKGYTYNDKLLRSASVKINKIENNNENKEGNDKNE